MHSTHTNSFRVATITVPPLKVRPRACSADMVSASSSMMFFTQICNADFRSIINWNCYENDGNKTIYSENPFTCQPDERREMRGRCVTKFDGMKNFKQVMNRLFEKFLYDSTLTWNCRRRSTATNARVPYPGSIMTRRIVLSRVSLFFPTSLLNQLLMRVAEENNLMVGIGE